MEKVLFISFWNPTPKLPFKGLFIHEQIKALCERNSNIIFFEVNILGAKTKFFHKTIVSQPHYLSRKITLTIHSVFWKLIYVSPWLTTIIIKRILQSEYSSFSPSIIHSNIVFPCGVVGYNLSKKFRAKHIISEHWSQVKKVTSHPIFKTITLRTYQNCSAILCVSKFLANNIKTASGANQISIVPNIIDTLLFAYKPKDRSGNNRMTFTCIAHWEAPKRLDLIIESLMEFAEKGSQPLLLNVIGGGSKRDKFLNMTFTNLQINWLGYVPKNEIPQILHSTDYFLHASETETFSIVVGEALSTGTPVLASNTGAIPELINGKNGKLVNNTLQNWIAGLNEITNCTFNNYEIAMDVFDKYSATSVVQEIETIYREIFEGLNK